MPFESDEQRRYLFAKKPDVARKLAQHEPASAAERALKSMKDFFSGRYGAEKEKKRLDVPAQVTGARG